MDEPKKRTTPRGEFRRCRSVAKLKSEWKLSPCLCKPPPTDKLIEFSPLFPLAAGERRGSRDPPHHRGRSSGVWPKWIDDLGPENSCCCSANLYRMDNWQNQRRKSVFYLISVLSVLVGFVIWEKKFFLINARFICKFNELWVIARFICKLNELWVIESWWIRYQ